MGGPVYDNGLQPENLIWDTACKLVSSPESCPDKCAQFTEATPKPNGCYIANNSSNIPVVKIKGCDCQDANEIDKNSFEVAKIKRSPAFLDKLSVKNIQKLSLSQDSNTYISSDGKFKFKFILKDSTYDVSSEHGKNYSYMAQVLQNLPVSRRNESVENIIKQKFGYAGRNGAVIVLW